MVKTLYVSLAFLLLFSTLASAVLFDNPNLPIVKPTATSLPSGNITINVSVNSSVFWDTQDHGPLDEVGDIQHNWLGNLGWSTAGHTIDSDIDMNFNSIVDAFWVNTTYLNATSIFVSGNTIYFDSGATIGGIDGGIITNGNVTAQFYNGDGSNLTNINASQINYTQTDITTSGNITASNYTGNNFFGGNFYGVYDWTAKFPWLNFNGTLLTFNETYFNQTVQEQAKVTLRESVINVVSSGGSASVTTALLDFEIKEIKVNTTTGTKFRFEAIESTTGNIIDRNRKLHTTEWRIEKNYAINDAINISITSANPDDSFTIIIKYLNNFN